MTTQRELGQDSLTAAAIISGQAAEETVAQTPSRCAQRRHHYVDKELRSTEFEGGVGRASGRSPSKDSLLRASYLSVPIYVFLRRQMGISSNNRKG
jgi:hypothetical protein